MVYPVRTVIRERAGSFSSFGYGPLRRKTQMSPVS